MASWTMWGFIIAIKSSFNFLGIIALLCGKLGESDEISDNTVCLNFSTFKNFSNSAQEKARIFVPRVGPLTVTMALRNTLRLYHDYHKGAQT